MSTDRTYAQYEIEKKSLIVAYVLWAVIGYIGGHRFYLGRPVSGLIMLVFAAVVAILTFASFGILSFLWPLVGLWWIIDALLIPGMAAGSNNRIADRVLGRRY